MDQSRKVWPNRNLPGSIVSPTERTERSLMLQLQTSAGLVSIISAYTLTLTCFSEAKDTFYDELSTANSEVPLQQPLLSLRSSSPELVLITTVGYPAWVSLESGRRTRMDSVYWSSAVFTVTASPTPSLTPSFNTECHGDTPGPSTGTSSTSSLRDTVGEAVSS